MVELASTSPAARHSAPPIDQRARLAPALAWCGIVGPALIITITALAAAQSGTFDPVSDTVSDLAAQDAPDTLLVRAGMFAFGALTMAFAAGLAATLGESAPLARIALSTYGAGVALGGVFQDHSEAPGIPKNREGFLHNTVILIAIAALAIGMMAAVLTARGEPTRTRFSSLSLALLLIILVSGSAFLLGPSAYEGLFELVTFGAALAWLVAGAVHTLTATPGTIAAEAQIRIGRWVEG